MELKGLKFLIEVTSKTLDTDIKSIKKAARRGIKEELEKMLVREKRLEIYESCIKFLKTRIKLDQSGFTEDIFQH